MNKTLLFIPLVLFVGISTLAFAQTQPATIAEEQTVHAEIIIRDSQGYLVAYLQAYRFDINKEILDRVLAKDFENEVTGAVGVPATGDMDSYGVGIFMSIFGIEAQKQNISDFKITEVVPNQKTEFTMHAMSPEFVLHLCQSLYDKFPKTYLLHIKGYEFEFLGQPTAKASENLKLARKFLSDLFSSSSISTDLFETLVQ